MSRALSVAIPVRDGAEVLERTLAAVVEQELPDGTELQLLVCDSGSRDGSIALARSFGAEVVEIPAEQFAHGETRNLLMRRSGGEHVAFLTQDSVPAGRRWLEKLMGGFALADHVALTFGPYLPAERASPMVARELSEWFRSFSPDGSAQLDRLAPEERTVAARALLGRRGFFTDANGCVARAAWQAVPFRPVAYAEDHVLAHDMLRAGYAKVYIPDAAVIHSHDYAGWGWLRRSFDEARALQAVYGFAPSWEVGRIAREVWGLVGADWRWAHDDAAADRRPSGSPALLARSLRHHLLCSGGALLGSRADRLPASLVRRLSLEGRGGEPGF